MNGLELTHFGVLGMRWGKRKALVNPHKDYTKARQDRDDYRLGNTGVHMVNRLMNKGHSYEKAYKKTKRRIQFGTMAVIGLSMLTVKAIQSNPQFLRAGKEAAQKIFMSTTGRNVVSATGDILLNPKNYKVR